MEAFIFIILIVLFFVFIHTTSQKRSHRIELQKNLQAFETKKSERLRTVTTNDRGTVSERNLVLKLLDLEFDARAIFHDIYIKKENKDYTQIDLVLATKVGIFVFEVKDYSGWLFGNANNKFWTQVLAYGSEKHRFYNPIKQNESHIKALKHQLKDIGNIPFYSIIVFYGNCELKEISNIPERTFVCYHFEVKNVVKNIMASAPNAQYLNKQKVMDVLQEGIKNGASHDIIKKHIEKVEQVAPQSTKITQSRKSYSYRRSTKPVNPFKVIRILKKWL